MQFLRGALAGLGVEREVASHFFLAVHLLLFSEEYDVFLEFFQCRIKMLVQQDTVAASHADHFTEQLVFRQAIHLLPPALVGSDAAAVLWDDIVVFSFHLFFSILFFSYAREAGFASTSAVVQWVITVFRILRLLRSFQIVLRMISSFHIVEVDGRFKFFFVDSEKFVFPDNFLHVFSGEPFS